MIHGCRETNCNTTFVKNDLVFDFAMDERADYFSGSGHGTFVHDDCWKAVKIATGIELTYSHLPSMHQKFPNLPDGLNYGIMERYWGQEFDYEGAFRDKNAYVCYSPLKNQKNATRIRKIISQLRLKKNRKGPPVSATFFKTGDIRFGNDGHFWTKSNNKWVRLPGDPHDVILVIKSAYDPRVPSISKIPMIGATAKKTVMVKSVKNVRGGRYVVTLVTTEPDKIKKKYSS